MTSAIAPVQSTTPTALAPAVPPTRQGMAQLIVLPPAGADAGPSWGLVRATPQGHVKAIRTDLVLSRQAGHVYELRGEVNITASGYDYINQALGVTFFSPETTTGEDGQPHCNPYVIRDEHDVIQRIKIQIIGFARNAVGNWMGIASTLYYDLDPCFAQDVLKKWRPKTGAIRDWGVMYSAENVPEKVRKDPNRKCIKIPGGYVLACEFRGEFLDVVSEHAHRVRFATRIAETIAKRRILAAFIGRRKPTLNQDKSMTVSVTSWQQADREHIEELVKQAKNVRGGQLLMGGEPIEMQEDTATVDHATESEIIGEETTEGDGASLPTEAAPDTEQPPAPKSLDALRARARELMEGLSPEVLDEILTPVGFEGPQAIAECTTPVFLESAIDALEQKQKQKQLEKLQAQKAPAKSPKPLGESKGPKHPAKPKTSPPGKLFDDRKHTTP